MDIQVKNLDHLGIVAGIVDQIGLVEEIDRQIKKHPQQIISTGQVVKAMILNGLGFVSAPLYLFGNFFQGKATEHLLGEGIEPEHLNDDRMGRALDSLWNQGLSSLFTSIAMLAQAKFNLGVNSLHLDSSSISVEGKYETETVDESDESIKGLHITYGHSKDHRPDLKQFLIDVICTGDSDVPLFVRIADGNESDKAIFAKLISEFRDQWNLDSIYIADSALYSEDNLQQLGQIRWITRVPATIKAVNILLESLTEETFEQSEVEGYRIASCCSDYGQIHQRWLVIESESGRIQQLKQLNKRLKKQHQKAQGELNRLMKQDFSCRNDAIVAAQKLSQAWKYHQLKLVEIETHLHYAQSGRPRKDQKPKYQSYRLKAQVVNEQDTIELAKKRAGKFILATNILDDEIISNDEVLREYKGQQSSERGFRFLKDPLFFTSSVFLNTPSRVAALAMVMGLCLLVYTLGQRQLREALSQEEQTIPNQLGKPTATPTLRWVFQCFQAVHIVTVDSHKQVANLTDARLWILRFFGSVCQRYYLLC